MGQPTLVVVGGLALHGKTTLGRRLAEETGLHFCDSDDLRGVAFGLPTREEYERQWENPEKAAEWTKHRMAMGYRLLHDGVVDIALDVGQSLIIAATYSTSTSQKFMKAAVEKHGATLKLIVCRLFDENREEIEGRLRRDDGKEYILGCATWNDYAGHRERYEAPDETGVFPDESILVVDTTNPVEGTKLDEVIEFINR